MRGVTAILVLVWVAMVSMPVLTGAQATKGGNPKAAAVKNPVKATPDSVTKGRQAYSKTCRHCHGLQGKGDGPLATKNPSPADLTDATWDYGSTDGEIYAIIANGVGGNSVMVGMRSQLTATDMWNIVNFLRSIGPKS